MPVLTTVTAPSHTASSQPRATQLQLEHSCLSFWTPHQYPALPETAEHTPLLKQSHRGILPAIKFNTLCHLARRAQHLQFLSSRGFAELPDRPWLRRLEMWLEPFKANHGLCFQQQNYKCSKPTPSLSSRQAQLSALILFLASTSSPPVMLQHPPITGKQSSSPAALLPLEIQHLPTG